jgi:benzoyl-CoA reductase/2-hydroxyglutaryl-CoA dehydratase subunit BcrC/BadD/HgdB
MAESILREIDELIREHTNPYVDEWKSAGNPVVGYFCHYMPAEIILAAGALPLRLRGAGSQDSSLGDAYMSGRVCTYVRHVMSLALEGKYDFLDGVVCSNTCDHVRRSADLFAKKTSIPFQGFLSVPRSPRGSLYSYYRDELRAVLEGMASTFGTEASDDSLRGAICSLNHTRRRLIALNRLRLEDKPKLSGAEALAVHIVAQVTPPAVFGEIADRLLSALESRPGLDSSRARLVLVGAELDEPAYVRAIESQGALVVADRLCFGARSVLDPIDEDAADPLDAIGRAYFFRPSCARMIGDFPNRWLAIEQMVEEARADGVVFERLLFCDPWGADLHNMTARASESEAFPLLALSREYGIVPTGQVRTRIQAFVEKIEIGRARDARRDGR